MAPVQQHAARIGACRTCDAGDELVAARPARAHDVDAAEHDPPALRLQHERTGLERQPVALGAVLLANVPDHRQPERRHEVDVRGTGAKPAHDVIRPSTAGSRRPAHVPDSRVLV